MRLYKQRVFEDLKQEYARMAAHWSAGARFDSWFDRPLNNAHLVLARTYERWVPAFLALLCRENGNFKAFYATVEQLSKLPRAQRQSRLARLQSGASAEHQTSLRSCP